MPRALADSQRYFLDVLGSAPGYNGGFFSGTTAILAPLLDGASGGMPIIRPWSYVLISS